MPRTGIYKLTNRNRPDRMYIGSSNNIDLRFYKHKSAAVVNGRKDGHFPLYAAMREDGPENYECEFLEDLVDCNREMMRQKEQYYISLLNPSLNCRNAFLTAEQAYLQRKSHWEIRNKQSKACECGCVVRKACFARHRRSVKHRRKMIEKLMAELRVLFGTFGVGLRAVWLNGGDIPDAPA